MQLIEKYWLYLNSNCVEYSFKCAAGTVKVSVHRIMNKKSYVEKSKRDVDKSKEGKVNL